MRCASATRSPREFALEIERAGGWLDFARYMELALYAPGLGYYSAGSAKLGAAGDFVTAPELGDLLGRAIAAALRPVLARFDAPDRARARRGQRRARRPSARCAGGRLARAHRLSNPRAERGSQCSATASCYGASARASSGSTRCRRGRSTAQSSRTRCSTRCRCRGFVSAATPCLPLGVVARGERIRLGRRRPSAGVARRGGGARESASARRSPEGYRSEICLRPARLARGAGRRRSSAARMLFVDYGLVRREYYHPQRSDGTLICHYRHRAHADPFRYPGLQDSALGWTSAPARTRRGPPDSSWRASRPRRSFCSRRSRPTPPRPGRGCATRCAQLAALKTLRVAGRDGRALQGAAARARARWAGHCRDGISAIGCEATIRGVDRR